MNNRSMGLDTEINVTWEGSPNQNRLVQSIRDIRANLLAEHIGSKDLKEMGRLASAKGLVDYLDRLASDGSCRLRRHPSLDGNPADSEILSSLFPDGLPFDLEEPRPDEIVCENSYNETDSFFIRGITSLKNMFTI
jgi:phospholipase D1/2